MKPINLVFNNRPSFANTMIKIIAGKSSGFIVENGIPEITASWNSLKTDTKHYKKFNTICNLEDSNTLPLTYPLTLTCPLFLRILAQKQAPLSLFRSLNTRCKIIQHRAIRQDETMNLNCLLSEWRIVEKGLEVDLNATITIGDEIVWENTNTYYYRGKFGEADPDFVAPKVESIPDAEELTSWFFPGGKGFKFAKISGDTNGLHFMPRYSKMFGYKRDFSQPFLIIANSLKYLPAVDYNQPVCLETEIKGPVYYNSELKLKNETGETSNRFDIYCQDNPRPCLSGKLYTL